MNETLLYIGSIVIILWGIAHVIPTKAIVNGFGEISEDNRSVSLYNVLLIHLLFKQSRFACLIDLPHSAGIFYPSLRRIQAFFPQILLHRECSPI